MSWITLIVLGAFLTAGAGVLDRHLMERQTVPSAVAAVSFGVVGLPVGIAGMWLGACPPWPAAVLAILAGGLFVVAAWLYYDTVGREAVSRLMPLLRLTAPQALLLGVVFLDETLTGRQVLAFGVMLVGGTLLVLKPHPAGVRVSRAALRLLPVTTLLAVNQVLMAHVYRTTSLWVGIAWENLGMAVGAILVWGGWHAHRSRHHRGGYCNTTFGRRRATGIWGLLLLEQALRLVTGLAPAWAVAQGVPVGVVSAVGGVRAAWVWVLAVVILREPVERREALLKGAGMLGMGLGVYLLA